MQRFPKADKGLGKQIELNTYCCEARPIHRQVYIHDIPIKETARAHWMPQIIEEIGIRRKMCTPHRIKIQCHIARKNEHVRRHELFIRFDQRVLIFPTFPSAFHSIIDVRESASRLQLLPPFLHHYPSLSPSFWRFPFLVARRNGISISIRRKPRQWASPPISEECAAAISCPG